MSVVMRQVVGGEGRADHESGPGTPGLRQVQVHGWRSPGAGSAGQASFAPCGALLAVILNTLSG